MRRQKPTNTEKPISVFISSSKSDLDIGHEIASVLESLDVESILYENDDYWDISKSEPLPPGLAQCNCLLAIVSPENIQSQWLSFEIGYALGAGKTVLLYSNDLLISLPTIPGNIFIAKDLEGVRNYFADLALPPTNQDDGLLELGYPDSSKDKHLQRDYFLIGCGIGNRIAIYPFDSDNLGYQGLMDFLDAVGNVGLGDNYLVQIALDVKEKFSSKEYNDFKAEELRELTLEFYEAMDRLPGVIRDHASPDGYKWFRLGELLYEIVLNDFVDPASALKSGNTALVAFESQIEKMELTNTLKEKSVDFVKTIRDGRDSTDIMESANQLAQLVSQTF